MNDLTLESGGRVCGPRALLAAVALLFVAVFASGCDLIWEPPETAAERLMRAAENRDRRTIGEYFDNEELELKMRRLSAAFDGPLYDEFGGTPWKLNGIEEDDDNGYTYVWVDVSIPSGRGAFATSVQTTDMVLEMDRQWLRWTVLNIEGIDDVLNRIEQQRK